MIFVALLEIDTKALYLALVWIRNSFVEFLTYWWNEMTDKFRQFLCVVVRSSTLTIISSMACTARICLSAVPSTAQHAGSRFVYNIDMMLWYWYDSPVISDMDAFNAYWTRCILSALITVVGFIFLLHPYIWSEIKMCLSWWSPWNQTLNGPKLLQY